MFLRRMKLRNFRCYREELSIEFSDLTAIIGKNDAGKSTILEALDIFLNEGSPDKDDGTKGGNLDDITITCEFSDVPADIVLDETNSTKLEDEFLLNAEGFLEIQKTYDGTLVSPKLRSTRIIANHPSRENVADLLTLSNANLKVRAKSLGLDLSDIDQTKNAELRKIIRDKVGELDLKLQMLDTAGMRTVWQNLKMALPSFALFKSDRTSTDQDPEAQDPLKIAIREALKAKQKELEAITAFVQIEVQKIASATLTKLCEMDASLANELTPRFSSPKWETLFKASITGDNEISINKRGSGVKRLILLNFFRAKAELEAGESRNLIYGIEEPETSQHPNNQRLLIRALSDLSTRSQVILTTHTPMLARSLPSSDLRFVNVKTDGVREVLTGAESTNKIFTDSLGVLPDNSVKLFIGVEGKHDIQFLQQISDALIKDGMHLPNLSAHELDGSVIFFPLGGSTLVLWINRLQALNRPEFHLFDRDFAPPKAPKYQTEIDQVNIRPKCKARSTAKRETENYLHWKAIKGAYNEIGIALPISSNFGDFDDVPFEVAKLVHESSSGHGSWSALDEKQREKKESKAKSILNGRAPKYMNKVLLDEIDPTGDLLEWFDDIKSLLSG